MGDFSPTLLAARGFSLAGKPLQSRIDSLYEGTAFLAPDPGWPIFVPKHLDRLGPVIHYNGDELRSAGTSELAFAGTSLRSISVFTSEYGGVQGAEFNAAIGLGVLRLEVFNFDFIFSRLWIASSSTGVNHPTRK